MHLQVYTSQEMSGKNWLLQSWGHCQNPIWHKSYTLPFVKIAGFIQDVPAPPLIQTFSRSSNGPYPSVALDQGGAESWTSELSVDLCNRLCALCERSCGRPQCVSSGRWRWERDDHQRHALPLPKGRHEALHSILSSSHCGRLDVLVLCVTAQAEASVP